MAVEIHPLKLAFALGNFDPKFANFFGNLTAHLDRGATANFPGGLGCRKLFHFRRRYSTIFPPSALLGQIESTAIGAKPVAQSPSLLWKFHWIGFYCLSIFPFLRAGQHQNHVVKTYSFLQHEGSTKIH